MCFKFIVALELKSNWHFKNGSFLSQNDKIYAGIDIHLLARQKGKEKMIFEAFKGINFSDLVSEIYLLKIICHLIVKQNKINGKLRT